jgi:uncharacterized peroxidase-related enzyme
MRLAILERGHRRKQRLALRVLRLVGGTEPDPVAKLSLYRPEFFGRAWLHFAEPLMRGPSDWSEGERELLAAFVSRLNSCPFCVGIHEGTSELLLGHDPAARLDRWREGGVEPRLAATFELLEKVTLSPEAVAPDDIERALSSGLSASAIEDALYVAFLFNVINRLANAFDFGWSTDSDRHKLAAGLNRIRYHVPDFLLR